MRVREILITEGCLVSRVNGYNTATKKRTNTLLYTNIGELIGMVNWIEFFFIFFFIGCIESPLLFKELEKLEAKMKT